MCIRDRDTAIVSVEKNADKTSVNIGDTLTYTITITNHANAGDDLVDPIVIDFLPQGAELAGTDEDVQLTDAGGPNSELTLDPNHAYRSESRGDDTAVLIFLVGTLAPGAVSYTHLLTARSQFILIRVRIQ